MTKANVLSWLCFFAMLCAFVLKVEVISIWGFLICMTVFSVGSEIEDKLESITKRNGNGR